jgi:hypothetical protein
MKIALRHNFEISSVLGCTLALVHASILIAVIFSRQFLPPPVPCEPSPNKDAVCFDLSVPMIAGRAFPNGPVGRFLVLADAPALLLGSALVGVSLLLAKLVLFPFGIGAELSRVTGSYIGAIVWILLGSIEWWLIGAYGERKLKQRAG